MGNKLKHSKNTEKNNKLIINQNVYLLCPNCFKKVPILNTFIEEDIAKIKIYCSCLGENKYIIMELVEYLNIVKNTKNTNMCINHEKQLSEKFCMNCENWLCNDCFINHSNDICKKAYYDKNNIENYYCDKHNCKKIYLCKKCMIIFCKTCFIHHNSRNKIKHKGSNVENYLTEDKINSKCNKFQIYINDIEDVIEAMKNDILKDINISEKNGNDIQKIKINFQEKYLIHKSINEELKLLLELILKNSEYFKSGLILNRKFLFDMIINTSINKKYPRLDKSKTIIEQMNYFLNFLKYNYISLKQEYFLKLLNKYENSSSKIEKMISLQDNKFIIINKDCEIQIYKINKDKNHPPEMLYSFNEHANNITCIILLKNKKNFATASDDSTIRIWDVEKGACIKTIITEGKPYLIFEKYGKDNQIGCVPNRNSLSIYEYGDKIQNTVFKISLEKSLPWIEGLYQFSNDGRIIISSFGIFDLYSSDLEKIKRIYIANMAAQNFLQITNEDLVVGFGSKDIFIYDKNINFKRKLLGHHNNVSSILQLNNNKLLTASLDSNIILWNIDNYEMIFNFMNNHLSINSMILINENRILTYSFFNLNIIEEWEIENSENIIK